MPVKNYDVMMKNNNCSEPTVSVKVLSRYKRQEQEHLYMKKIGIIGAMEVEVAALKSAMKVSRMLNKAQMEFLEGELEGCQAVVVRSGIGKVNAAVCTQILVDEFGVDGVINTGIAGSLKAEINIGDIVLSTDVLHHDMDATGFGYDLGQIPQMNVPPWIIRPLKSRQ